MPLRPLKTTLLASAIVAASAQVIAAADDDNFKLTGGAEFSSGSYGADEDTDILYLPITLAYETDAFRFSASTSYLKIEGPGSVVGGDGGIVIGPGTAQTTSESGLGDLILAGTLNAYPEAGSDLPYLELTAKVKVPTADEDKGLGTGEIDYSLQADVFKSFGTVTPFATLGYKVRGDVDGFELNDGLFASAGAVVKMSEKLSLGGAYDFREAATDTSEDASEVSPFVNLKVTPDVMLTTYGIFGFSDGSPDSGLGVQLRKNF